MRSRLVLETQHYLSVRTVRTHKIKRCYVDTPSPAPQNPSGTNDIWQAQWGVECRWAWRTFKVHYVGSVFIDTIGEIRACLYRESSLDSISPLRFSVIPPVSKHPKILRAKITGICKYMPLMHLPRAMKRNHMDVIRHDRQRDKLSRRVMRPSVVGAHSKFTHRRLEVAVCSLCSRW